MAARNPSETMAATAAGMASLDLSARFDDDQSVDIISVDGCTFDQIVEFIVDAHRNGTESILSLRCSADLALGLGERLDGKLTELDQPHIRRFEYDYHSGIAYIDIMGETQLHYQCQKGIEWAIELSFGRFVAAIPDAAVRDYIIKTILNFGTSQIAKEGKILKQADIALGDIYNKLPSFACEISYSESRSHVERKIIQYIDATEGEIRAAAVLKIQYPGAKWVAVGLRVADGSSTGAWIQHFDAMYDEKLPQQPDGQLAFYISDFIGATRLPTNFCRPSATELAAGVVRVPQVVLTYERLRNIFLKARSIYQGTYDKDSDENEENVLTILMEGYQERLRADKAEQQAEEAKKQAEEAKKQAEEAKKQAEEAKQRLAALEAPLLLHPHLHNGHS